MQVDYVEPILGEISDHISLSKNKPSEEKLSFC